MGVNNGGHKCFSRKLRLTISVNDFWTTTFKFSEQVDLSCWAPSTYGSFGYDAGRHRRWTQKGKQTRVGGNPVWKPEPRPAF